eukprot:98195-Pelagomonas_calceolata.AAC.7
MPIQSYITCPNLVQTFAYLAGVPCNFTSLARPALQMSPATSCPSQDLPCRCPLQLHVSRKTCSRCIQSTLLPSLLSISRPISVARHGPLKKEKPSRQGISVLNRHSAAVVVRTQVTAYEADRHIKQQAGKWSSRQQTRTGTQQSRAGISPALLLAASRKTFPLLGLQAVRACLQIKSCCITCIFKGTVFLANKADNTQALLPGCNLHAVTGRDTVRDKAAVAAAVAAASSTAHAASPATVPAASAAPACLC